MLEEFSYNNTASPEADIARYEVSEDGVTWRPYDPRRDRDRPLHKRIEFSPTPDE